MSPVLRDSAGGRAYLGLQARARSSGRPTDELIQLYALEGFLARLAVSPLRDHFVLTGGVLLAAFGDRRPTRDVDLAGLDLDNDAEVVRRLVCDIVAVRPPVDDGLEFDPSTTTSELIREADQYAGVRVGVEAWLARARSRFHVDVNVGDPIWPEAEVVRVPRLMGGPPIELSGYLLHMVHAEKIVTAVQRGVVNTRWRDFADVWTLTRRHPVDGSDLQTAIAQVGRHRQAQLAPLVDTLPGYAALAQGRWAAWRRRNSRDQLPESFATVLDSVIRFADPALAQQVEGREWNPSQAAWQ
ncbi:MAG: nucleotidyl transferase AbiEii/AbiGii toxin family protein [Candidatus Nanopelagicales bacterium]